jgi:flagella basal body P-ring formation protein FlgA
MQSFTLSSGKQSMAIDVQVTQAPKVVVATVALPRGTVVQSADVQLQDGKAAEGNAKAIGSIEDVVGKETTRNVGAGQMLEEQMVRAPLVVRRGEVVDVVARSAGIKVRVKGRSRGDGAMGDLVTVESVTDRKAFLARVCGAQEVEVFAQATVAETAAVSGRR